MATSRTTVTAEYAMSLIERLANMLQAFAENPGDVAFAPAPDCPALLERSTLPANLDPLIAYYQAGLLQEASTDNLIAFTKLFHAPVPTIAPYVCIRAALESSAIAGWLADPEIQPRERVARSLSFRKEGIEQQKTLVKAQSPGVSSQRFVDGIRSVDAQLAILGEQKTTRKTGAPPTKKMPAATELVRDILHMEADYRFLSAVAHAHQWALQQVAFQIIRDPGPIRIERKLEPVIVVYLCTLAAKAFVLPVKMMTRQFGWQAEILSRIIPIADMIASEPVRFVSTPT